MTIYGDLLTLVVLQPSWTDESRCTDGNTTVFSVEFLQQLTGRSWLSGFDTVHWCTCCLFCQRMCSIHTFAISKKALPCWKIWLWFHMGNSGCDSNKHLEAAKFDRILHEFERFVWYPFWSCHYCITSTANSTYLTCACVFRSKEQFIGSIIVN